MAELLPSVTNQMYFITSHLKGFDESPQQGADALPSAEQLNQPHDSKQTEEGDGDASAVLCVLRRDGAESEASGATVWGVNTDDLAVLLQDEESDLSTRYIWAERATLRYYVIR